MRILKLQYVIFGILFLFSLFVIFIVLRSNNQNIEDRDIEGPYHPSLPPLGTELDNTASIELETGTVLDLGTVPNDKETTRKLKVFNKGKTILSLKDIRTTCACTIGTIPIGQASIPPNGEGYIVISFYPGKVAGFFSEKTLTIFSNDFKNPITDLKVIAKIDPEFICEPESIDFGIFEKGSNIERKIHITQKSMKKPLEINKVYEMNLPNDIVENDLTVVLKKIKSEEPVEYILSIKAEENISPGEFTRELFLSTNIDRFPEVPIRIKGTVTALYKINPSFPKPFIVLPSISTETSNTRNIEILPQSEENTVELISYEIIPDYFTAHLISDKNISGIKINIEPKITEKELLAVLKLKLRVNGIEYQDHVLLKTISLTH